MHVAEMAIKDLRTCRAVVKALRSIKYEFDAVHVSDSVYALIQLERRAEIMLLHGAFSYADVTPLYVDGKKVHRKWDRT